MAQNNMWRPRQSAQRVQRARCKPTATLVKRAQQWIAARERLIAAWLSRTHRKARASMQMRVLVRQRNRSDKLGGAGAIKLPQWWEYESPLKRRLALEAVLRRMFSLLPA